MKTTQKSLASMKHIEEANRMSEIIESAEEVKSWNKYSEDALDYNRKAYFILGALIGASVATVIVVIATPYIIAWAN